MPDFFAFFTSLFNHANTSAEAHRAAYITIEFWQLLLATGFVFLAGVLSVIHKLRLERDLAIGTVRVFVQLFAIGYILDLIFSFPSVWLVMIMYTATAWFATSIAKRKVVTKGVNILLPTFLAMVSTCFLITSLMSGAIIQAKPWWSPQYFIPVGGMVAGNAMNSLSIALERFFSELRLRHLEVEALLCLGASPAEASQDMFRVAMRAGMINSINAMMGVGLVSLPGMMTGQILSGVAPTQAIRYQVVIALMLTASAALSSFTALYLVRGRCFTPGAALRPLYDSLSEEK